MAEPEHAVVPANDGGDARGVRLTFDDKVEIMRLLGKGYAQEQIATMVGCSQSTVSRVATTIDQRPVARMILEAGSPKMAQTVVDTDDANVALKGLGAIDVVPRDNGGYGHTNVLVVVGQPGAVPPELEPPVIDVTPVLPVS
jgi:hypothetical protein